MILVNTETIQGKKIEHLGLVKGSCIRAKHLGHDIANGIKAMFGGELTSYSEMINEARAVATKRMVENAGEMEADAVVNIRYSSTAVKAGSAEVMVYGTAVKFVK
ncbi:MAG: hypothetical protein DRP86_06720 [Candidatus Neomarinimicrobiota bacterium]|nr:YbjQ family protein [Candidatus Neomarinimicrobiota bacterium]RKY48260.1 MAG: hypothetical protein DRP86_06720 [Candidatus Neomarinimicrobiota bacterium]